MYKKPHSSSEDAQSKMAGTFRKNNGGQMGQKGYWRALMEEEVEEEDRGRSDYKRLEDSESERPARRVDG